LQAYHSDLQHTETQRGLQQALRAKALGDLEALAPALAAAEAALTQWQQQWGDALDTIGLPPDSLPAEATARIARYVTLEAALTALESCTALMMGHDQTLAAFAADVARLAADLGEPGPADGPAAVGQVESWHTAVGLAQAAQEQARQLDEDIATLEADIAEARQAEQSAEATLAALCREAGVADTSALPEIEVQLQARATAATKLDELEASLREQFGKPVEDLVAEAEGREPDALGIELEALALEIAEADAEVWNRHEALITARHRFDAIDGSATAAQALQSQAGAAAEIDTLARRWARVRMADRLLGQVIERWGALHKGPLLERASGTFARITLRSFAGLTTDYEDDHQHLLGVRPGGGTVRVDGMSQGTRDQLFLALRLATIESHLASRGPFPVIADDLLVQFDDDRALATLEVLQQLSRRTQVLLFTHHRHLAELVKGRGMAGQVAISHLPVPTR